MRYLRFVLIMALALGLLGSCACAAKDPDVAVFKGDDPAQEGVSLGGWGSGGAAKTNERVLDGAWSIKVTSQGFYSGGKIEYAKPVTLYQGEVKRDRYIQFAFFFGPNDTKVVNPAAGYEYAMTDVEPYTEPKSSKMRFVFVSDSGETVEAIEPTGPLDPDDNWMRVAVPLEKFRSKELPEFRMKRLMIFTDIPCTFYMGSMKLTTDDTPIKVDSLDSRTTSVMYTEYFVANATGGVSSLKYSWDFDSTNGIQSECTDRTASYVYTRGGEHTVTLTVSDANGLKEPVTVSAVIEVTD